MDFLNNTDIVVGIGFVIFIGVLIYFGVPGLLTKQLDKRAAGIRADLDEARALREEAQTLLASYERKQKEVAEQAEQIVAAAKADAEAAAETAKDDIRKSVERRLVTAGEQIDAAEQAAIREVRDRAISVAIGAAGEVISQKMRPGDADALMNASIAEVGEKLH